MVTKLTYGDPWPGVTMVAIEVYLKLQVTTIGTPRRQIMEHKYTNKTTPPDPPGTKQLLKST